MQSSMKYIHTINFKYDDYEEATVSSDEEIKQLGKTGWIKYDKKNCARYYRKPNKFRSFQRCQKTYMVTIKRIGLKS